MAPFQNAIRKQFAPLSRHRKILVHEDLIGRGPAGNSGLLGTSRMGLWDGAFPKVQKLNQCQSEVRQDKCFTTVSLAAMQMSVSRAHENSQGERSPLEASARK